MGIGFLEIVIIGVAALVLLGPQKLPEVMKQVARLYVHLRRSSNEFKSAFDHVVQKAEEELLLNELKHKEQTTHQFTQNMIDAVIAPPPPSNQVPETSVSQGSTASMPSRSQQQSWDSSPHENPAIIQPLEHKNREPGA